MDSRRRHVPGGGHEALNMLLGEPDMLQLLRSSRAGIKQSESQKRRKQRTQKPPPRGHRICVSNKRHCMVLHLGTLLHPMILAAAWRQALGRGYRSQCFTPMLCEFPAEPATANELVYEEHGESMTSVYPSTLVHPAVACRPILPLEILLCEHLSAVTPRAQSRRSGCTRNKVPTVRSGASAV